MPSFDIVSEIDRMEVKNAVDQALRELATRFDFKGVKAEISLDAKTGSLHLACEDAARLKGLREIVMGRLARRGVDLRNIEEKPAEVSPLGHARQELAVRQGLEGPKAKEIIAAIKALGLKVQAALQDRQVRVTGAKKDDLQRVIGALRARDFGVALQFKNFRD